MSYASAFPVEPSVRRYFSTHTAPAANVCPFYEKKRAADQQFIRLLEAYRHTGGLARTQEVIALFRRRRELDLRRFQHWIEARKVISFEWHTHQWMPLFQFHCFNMALQPGLSQVLTELIAVYDHWEVAEWFVQPTPLLRNSKPVEALGSHPEAVLDAARMDRFLIRG